MHEDHARDVTSYMHVVSRPAPDGPVGTPQPAPMTVPEPSPEAAPATPFVGPDTTELTRQPVPGSGSAAGLAGRDPRRLFSEADRTAAHTAQGGACGVCTGPLPENFHVHHRTPWASGGSTTRDNALAVCPPCHTAAPVSALAGLELRDWQAEAAPVVLRRLRAGLMATVAACPGAGKTLFSAHVANELAAAGDIDRVVVFAPTTTVRQQWVQSFARLGIHLDAEPRYGVERRGYAGAVFTYHALTNDETVHALHASVEDGRTLVLLDEAHHLGLDESGTHTAWSARIARIAGTTSAPRTPVLNLTGTPFRSSRAQRISTLEYVPVPGQPDRIQTRTDYQITSNQLIDAGLLRHVSVLQFDTRLRLVELRGPTEGRVTDASVIDLDDHDATVRSAALAALLRDVDNFIDPQLDALIEHLASQQRLIGAPVKGLVIADDTAHADLIHARLRRRIGDHAYVAHSKSEDPASVLERFRSMNDSGIAVSVRMLSEGFDAPQVASIATMTRITAPLFVHQTVARAMRVTEAERRSGLILPATVMVPADPAIVASYSSVLIEQMRLLDVRPVCPDCGARPCACRPLPPDKQCRACAMPWRLCTCTCTDCGDARSACGCPRRRGGQPVDVTVLQRAELGGVSHDGVQVAFDLISGIDWTSAGVPPVFVPSAAAAVQATLETRPYDLAVAVRAAAEATS